MPYIYCPGCRPLQYSAAAHSATNRCPRRVSIIRADGLPGEQASEVGDG